MNHVFNIENKGFIATQAARYEHTKPIRKKAVTSVARSRSL